MSQQLPLGLDDAPKAPRAAALRHFNVRDESPSEAMAGEARARTQEARIMALFRSSPRGARLTPWEITERLGICINSVRRAITNATDRGELVHHKADRRPAGPFGQRSRTWSLA